MNGDLRGNTDIRGMNDRIKNLRKESEETHPELTIERAQLVTEAYKKYEGKYSIPILRAKTFKHLMENKTICINENELIVGERGTGPQKTPTYPELCCHTLDDFDVINNREKISYKVDESIKRVQKEEIIPFWKGKSIREKIFANMSQKWKDSYEAGIFTEFMEQRAPGHTVAGNNIFQKGFLDFKEEIQNELSNLDFLNDENAQQKKEQLEAMDICASAIITFAKRHSEKAKELAEKETNDTRKKELLDISRVCSKVPANAPNSFWEAIQYYWFVHLGVITELNTWDAFSPGRLDQHLYPLYKKEIENGNITRDKAKELLEALWIKFNNQPAPPKVGITLKESGTYTDFANINVGGITPEGEDGVNDVSFILLEVIDELKLLQPSSNIQISKKTTDKFLKEGINVIKKGWGQPSVFNVDAIIQELLIQGKSIIDARNGGISGCVETGAFGNESYILTGYFNLTKILEITLNQGRDPATGKMLGLEMNHPSTFKSFVELLDAYEKQLNYFIDIKITGNNIIEKLYKDYMPAPFLSIIIDDCIKNGKDYNAGGARYNTNYIQGVGIGSLTDSLTAIKYHIYDKKTFSWEEILNSLKDNFSSNEIMRQILINKTPKYGNDEDYADNIMVEAFNKFYNAVNNRKSIRGGTYRINMLPTTSHVYFGSVIGATPDGRKANMPLSEGISPVQGSDKKGPTAIIKSAAKMDQVKTGGTLLNQKFTPKLLEDEKGIMSLANLIRAYFKLDGHHIQFNVIDAKTLRKAQKEPEKYRNLIVRVAGYSDYFNNLSEELQKEIITRTEHPDFF